MSINSYQSNGKTLWKVTLNIRSKDRSVRLQRKVMGLATEKAAHAEEKKLYRELSEELAKKISQGCTWDDLVGRWEMAMRNDPNKPYLSITIIDMTNCMRKWTADWLNRPASELNKGDGREVLLALKQAGRSKGYQRHVKSVINVIYTWGIENRQIKGVHESPVRGVSVEDRQEEKVPDILTIEEIKKLLRDAQALEHPWYPVWAMALLTGMRNGELYALLWSDVDFDTRRMTVSKSYNPRLRQIKSTKSGKWRTIPISPELMTLLVKLKAESDGRPEVLPRVIGWRESRQAQVLRKFCLGIGLRSIRFHALRACFATQLLANDIAPARVMKVCGWADLKTMQHYVRLAGVDERGATDSLKLLPSDEACMGEVVRLLDFKGTGGKGRG